MKNNGRFCTSCKQVGHKEHECKNKNKNKNANVFSIKLDSFYVLTKGTNGAKAKFIGAQYRMALIQRSLSKSKILSRQVKFG